MDLNNLTIYVLLLGLVLFGVLLEELAYEEYLIGIEDFETLYAMWGIERKI